MTMKILILIGIIWIIGQIVGNRIMFFKYRLKESQKNWFALWVQLIGLSLEITFLIYIYLKLLKVI